MSGIED